MDPQESGTVERFVAGLDDHDLLRLIAIEHEGYRPEALETARREVRRRGLEELDEDGFWRRYPEEELDEDGFCVRCREDTTDETPGDAPFILGFGFRLIGFEQPCPVCGSELRRKWICLLVPVLPLGWYRVIRKSRVPELFVGRRLVARGP